MRRPTVPLAMLALGIATIPGHAQSRPPAPAPAPAYAPAPPPPGVPNEWGVVQRADSAEDERAVLGISTSTDGRRDTLGLLITMVVDSGPAARAGLEEGNRIASINGVNLKAAPADAGEPDMGGLMARRLERELRKVKPGDEVSLDVWQDGRYRTIRVKTAAAKDVYAERESGNFMMRRVSADDRAVLGLRLGGGGSIRDTLGVFVVAVDDSGPAARAGIIEGDRIAAIDDVSLKVAREDAGDPYVTGLKASRLSRELSHVHPGDEVTLSVWDGDRYRTVRVKTAKASDLGGRSRVGFIIGDGGSFVMPPMHIEIPRIAVPRIDGERMRMEMRRNLDGDMEQMRDQLREMRDQIEQQTRAARDAERQAAREAARAAREAARASSGVWSTSWSGDDDDAAPTPMPAMSGGRSMARLSLSGHEGTLRMNGLSLTPVDDDLASYLGAGSEDGLLVVDARAPWDALHAGDVILAVDGAPLRHGDHYTLSLDSGHDTRFDVLRKGKRMSVSVKGTR